MNRLQTILPLSTLYSSVIMVTMILISGCTPTIQVATSDKPIEVNLNVKIEHEIKIKVDKETEQLFDNKATF